MGERVLLGRVDEIWRYPVKSMLGEQTPRAAIDLDGMEGDRTYALRDATDSGLVSAKRVAELFGFHARLARSGMLGIEFPDGVLMAGNAPGLDARLTKVLGREVTLVRLGESGTERIKTGTTAASTEGEGYFETSAGFHDSSDVHLLTSAQLERARSLYPQGDWDRRRFRPNLLIRSDEPALALDPDPGAILEIGTSVRLEVKKGCTRCVMTTHAQEDLPQDRQILATLARETANVLGTLCSVTVVGDVAVGDEVWMTRPS
jgi:uncharacterized protein